MRKKIFNIGKNWALFLFLVPLFFLTHSLSANFSVALYKTTFWQVVLYSLVSILIAGLINLLFHDFRKSAFVVFVGLIFNFTFGYFQAYLGNILGTMSPLSNYYVAFTTLLVILSIVVIFLYKNKLSVSKSFLFINTLFFALVLYEFSLLIAKHYSGERWKPYQLSKQFLQTKPALAPDIYVIIADEYAGQEELDKLFDYDNSGFFEQLKAKNFHVIANSRSNYNHTVYSMASLFNMDYLKLRDSNRENNNDIFLGRSIMEKSNMGYFLNKNGYRIFNCSYLPFDNNRPVAETFYFTDKASVLGHFTFVSRFKAFLHSNKETYSSKQNNDKMIEECLKAAVLQKTVKPKFIYTHFLMPHPPYVYDSAGKSMGDQVHKPGAGLSKKDYLGFLKYANNKLLSLIDFILGNSSRPPVILLAGDHGFRQFEKKVPEPYYFMNLCAVYLPNRNYELFYNGMSSVNYFRAILNAQFNQKLPFLPDRTIYVE